ncbi:unnamed protein product, partial [Iphiclides podalirius]
MLNNNVLSRTLTPHDWLGAPHWLSECPLPKSGASKSTMTGPNAYHICQRAARARIPAGCTVSDFSAEPTLPQGDLQLTTVDSDTVRPLFARLKHSLMIVRVAVTPSLKPSPSRPLWPCEREREAELSGSDDGTWGPWRPRHPISGGRAGGASFLPASTAARWRHAEMAGIRGNARFFPSSSIATATLAY